MRKKLAVLFATALVCAAFLWSPPPTKADLCETMYGCRVLRTQDQADCLCDAWAVARTCTICCLDNFGCCWSGGGFGPYC